MKNPSLADVKTTVKAKCMDCGEKWQTCPFDGTAKELCPLHPYRLKEVTHLPKRKILKAIKAFCLWCCGDVRNEVTLCPANDCPLWLLRYGRAVQNPYPVNHSEFKIDSYVVAIPKELAIHDNSLTVESPFQE